VMRATARAQRGHLPTPLVTTEADHTARMLGHATVRPK